MSKYIVAADRRTAYAELVARSSRQSPGCLLRISCPESHELREPNGLIRANDSVVLMDYAPLSGDVDDVWGNPTWRGAELIYSLTVGYGYKILVVDRIEWLLRDTEAAAKLRHILPKIYDGAHDCRCSVWIVNPSGCVEADSFMAGMRLAQGVRQMGGPQ